jgi:putative DNA primase/helicase
MVNQEEDIINALKYISAENREIWLKIGMAIKSKLGEAGFDIWDNWSKEGSNYNQKNAETTWRSIDSSGGITVATLFHIAKENGYTPNKPVKTSHTLNYISNTSKQDLELDRVIKADAAAKKASIIWRNAKSSLEHEYIKLKCIEPLGVRFQYAEHTDCHQIFWATDNDGKKVALKGLLLLLSLYDINGNLRGLQAIDEQGLKSFQIGIAKSGLFTPLCNGEKIPADYTDDLYLAEGFATACTIRLATNKPVIMAIDAGNIKHVSKAWRTRCPNAKIIIAGDVDKSGTGQKAAIMAAKDVNGMFVFSQFTKEELDSENPPSDFNDLHILHGLDAVKAAINNLQLPDSININNVQLKNTDDSLQTNTIENWPEPLPLVGKSISESYPLDALPDTILAAVKEVHDFTKAPIPLIVSSALGALSLSVQAYVDAQRAENLSGPVGLFLLTIADSGERKSTCDNFFMQAIRKYEVKKQEELEPSMQQFKANLEAWKSKHDGIKDQIRILAKKGNTTCQQEDMLCNLEKNKPIMPKIPKLIYGDATPEALKWVLAKTWPSGGIVSSEAGSILGAHGMKNDAIMLNLATLNELWDGKDISTERRTSESFTVKGARLTIALQVQEATLRNFFDRSGDLPRGSGFLARFLIAWPESTQGSRPFSDPPKNWPNLKAFNQKITNILEQTSPINNYGVLSPKMLTLTPDAKQAWVVFHDTIENQLGSSGNFQDVRDVASKIADNAVRLAAGFQVFKNLYSNVIELEALESGCRIATWHLNESRRFFGELALPQELINAVRLEKWLIDYCHRENTNFVTITKIQQYGPNLTRLKAKLEAAIFALQALGRVRSAQQNNSHKIIEVNPALLTDYNKDDECYIQLRKKLR